MFQEPDKYVHFPPSGLEKEQSSNPEFYQPDELKYHGHKLQRGYTQLNFFDEDKPTQSVASPHELNNDCHGHWKTPRDCSPVKHDCEYFISWQTVGKGDEVKFHIETNNTNTWTGVAFSDHQQMVNNFFMNVYINYAMLACVVFSFRRFSCFALI